MSPTIQRRDPELVMRLDRMGSFHQSRLSFMRVLLRRAHRERWRFERTRFDIDPRGVGTALYTVSTPQRSYTLVAFAHDLPAELRSDRVIATAWDATFTLFDGVPTDDDVERLGRNVPLQEAGRITESELTLARANRSVRLWDHTVEALAAGRQPDRALIDQVGYLMRTTAVYGSGKFGAADRAVIADRAEFTAPFQPEMLTVYLIRAFVADLVEHLAAEGSPGTAVTLDPERRRALGIGNSTGLGMAPFLLTHPRLISNWMVAREEALARVRSVDRATPAERSCFVDQLERFGHNLDLWRSDHPAQKAKLVDLDLDLNLIARRVASDPLGGPYPWDGLIGWSSTALSLEGQELLVSLVLEPYGRLVDPLVDRLHADESEPWPIDGSISVAEVRNLLERDYGWALDIDWSDPQADARVWYVSEEKLEPRLGERHQEPVGAYEQPLQPGRDAARFHHVLGDWPAEARLADVLTAHPEFRHIARRVLLLDRFAYGEIRDNTIAASMLPIDLLRCKLSFFGATRFDPRSDRWVRITMFQGAPYPNELSDLTEALADDWAYPPVGHLPGRGSAI